ncbi:MAG: hypothetical protein HXL68_13545 [Dechloromonas agitata]|uniref:Uncharacterized protein n=1 Tax=Dechloromonas agitata TaxID=73030 RepID=A0A930G0L9_9RHOO|nr:hypothetical protein [Dechloromonas agitata]
MNANIYPLPALVAVEFTHGVEAVPTLINGLPIQYTTIDVDGHLQAWNRQPEYTDGYWTGEVKDVVLLPAVDALVDGAYPGAADSLHRIVLADLLH